MRLFTYTIIAHLVLLFCSCASISKEQCQSQDWFEIGKEDALWGKAPKLALHQEECLKRYGILNAHGQGYAEGHDAGLFQLCTFDGGYTHGKRGRHYQNVCPKALEPQFLKGYRIGLELREALAEKKRSKKEAEDAKRKLLAKKEDSAREKAEQDRTKKRRRADQERRDRERRHFGIR